MPTKEELKKLQSDPLPQKVLLTKARIREWYYKWGGQVYVSFSGGKDSTVLLHLVRDEFPDVQAVFVDTGLEYPEIKQFVKQHENVKILHPKMGFANVIRKYGYPLLSKSISREISDYKRGKKYAMQFLDGVAVRKDGELSKFNIAKYKPITEMDFNVSNKCCDIMKKEPLHRIKDKQPFTAQLANESKMRESQWIAHGCNNFDSDHPISNPMSFWTEQDVLQYIKQNNIEICSVYGDIIPDGGNCRFVTGIASFARQDVTEPDAFSADMAHISKRARDVSKGSSGRIRSCMITVSAAVLTIRRTVCGSLIRTDWTWLMSLTS